MEQCLEILARRNGWRLTPKIIIDDARSPDSPLHSEFTWDNEIAGEKHRLTEARELIRSVKLKVTVDSRMIHIPKYVRDPRVPAHTQGYVPLDRARTMQEVALEIRRQEIERACSMIVRAGRVTEGLTETLAAEIHALEAHAARILDLLQAERMEAA